MKYLFLLMLCLCAAAQNTYAQTPYTSYFTGDTTDVTTPTKGGICLMGGATEHDSAMVWFLRQAGGGDIVVIRASGSNGYNNYLYTTLGETVNSVQTLVIASAAAANDPYVAYQIRHAEALWIAGGNQYNYVQYWRNSPVQAALQSLIDRHVPMGGTSAGMAIQGEAYFAAANGSATSAGALANPYDVTVDIGDGDFLHHRLLQKTITDTHYDNPDRRGRHLAFLARLRQQTAAPYRGIACEEYTAVCIDSAGRAKVYGDYPNSADYAYFLAPNCANLSAPERCAPNQPLTWDFNGEALKVYKVAGTPNGTNTFDLADPNWQTASGGTWENWSADNGVLATAPALAPNCLVATKQTPEIGEWSATPNPATDIVTVSLPIGAHFVGLYIALYNAQGQQVWAQNIAEATTKTATIAVGHLPKGVYWLKVTKGAAVDSKKIIVER